MLFYLNLIYIFMCIYLLFIVCCKVWTLGVWGELACHKRLFNPPPQFSRLGTWCPTYICKYCLSHICIWIEGCVVDDNFFLSFFLSFLFWLVCYKYTFHVHAKVFSIQIFQYLHQIPPRVCILVLFFHYSCNK